MVFLPVYTGHRIDHQMIMQVVLIQMGADNDLIPFSKQPLGKFQPDSVCLLWCDLPRLKGLDKVIAEDAAHFANCCLVSIISERAVSTLLQFNAEVKKNCSVFSGLEI